MTLPFSCHVTAGFFIPTSQDPDGALKRLITLAEGGHAKVSVSGSEGKVAVPVTGSWASA